jgi:hypothetical protein
VLHREKIRAGKRTHPPTISESLECVRALANDRTTAIESRDLLPQR